MSHEILWSSYSMRSPLKHEHILGPRRPYGRGLDIDAAAVPNIIDEQLLHRTVVEVECYHDVEKTPVLLS